MAFEAVPKEQIHLLASIFRHPTSEPYVNYMERVYCIEPQLDNNLLRPDFLKRLIQLPQSHYTPLCGLHKILNAKIVHQIFVLVATEVGVRLNSLVVAGRDKLGHETWDRSILNLRSVHGAWLHPEVFWDTFGKTLDVPRGGYSDEDYMTKWVHEQDKCEACILARIGGDLETVFDLQMLVKSRTHTRSVKKYREPRLGKVIDGWLLAWKLNYSANEWEKKLEWNRLRSSRLKDIRRDIAKERRRVHVKHGKHDTQKEKVKRPKVSAPIPAHERQRPDPNTRIGSLRNVDNNDSQETIQVYLSIDSNQGDNDFHVAISDDENSDDFEVRKTVHATENDIIDCYAALISTPFLPGMGNDEHRKRASRLSQHRSTMVTQLETPTWPMVANDQSLKRAQSTNPKRYSNYTESVYSQPAERIEPTSSKPKRSNSVQTKRHSEQSWATASIAPSAMTETSTRNHPRRPARHERAFDAIPEETLTPRRYISKFKEGPISPVLAPTKYQPRPDSPVSPLDPEHPFPLPAPDSDRSHGHSTSKPRRELDRPKISARLSGPFDGPAPGHTVLDSVRQLRDDGRRTTAATDMTRWSNLDGTGRDGVKHVEHGFRDMSIESKSKGSQRGRK